MQQVQGEIVMSKINCIVGAEDYIEVKTGYSDKIQINLADSVSGVTGAVYSVQLDPDGIHSLIEELTSALENLDER
jgi:hypothetical protein